MVPRVITDRGGRMQYTTCIAQANVITMPYPVFSLSSHNLRSVSDCIKRSGISSARALQGRRRAQGHAGKMDESFWALEVPTLCNAFVLLLFNHA